MPKADNQSNLSALTEQLRSFAHERDWAQFHTPKNLILALVSEVGELSDCFTWLTDEEISSMMAEPDRANHVKEELADTLGCLLRLADVLDIDVGQALRTKIHDNAKKYPIALARGSNRKYTNFDAEPRHTR